VLLIGFHQHKEIESCNVLQMQDFPYIFGLILSQKFTFDDNIHRSCCQSIFLGPVSWLKNDKRKGRTVWKGTIISIELVRMDEDI